MGKNSKIIESKSLKNGDIFLKDDKNKTYILTKETQEAWKKEFNLDSIEQDFIVPFDTKIKEILQNQGINEIKLGKGSLIKMLKENRLKYINRIKPTLLDPDRIIKQDENVYIFAKDFGEIKYFTSVAKNQDGEWIISSNAPKSHNGMDNKIKKGGIEIYTKNISKSENQADAQINARAPYDDIAKSNIKLSKQDSTKNAENMQYSIKS